MRSGADIAVTSAHKLLSSLSQGAILNAHGTRLDLGRLAAAVRMGQTTSPLVPILASLDACRRQMVLDGDRMLERTLELAASTRQGLESIPGITVRDAERLGLPSRLYDATRLVIDVQGLGVSGFFVERALRAQFGIAVEMSDLIGIVCLVTIGDSQSRVNRLIDALGTIAREQGVTRLASIGTYPRSAGTVTAPGEQVCSPRDAFFGRSRAVPLDAAAGEVAAELVVPYPPGIPVLVPGERITTTKIDYLAEIRRRGASVRGPSDPRLATVRVMAPPL
jgi:lysine decarboxylase